MAATIAVAGNADEVGSVAIKRRGKMPPRVLFLHGLESGPGNAKQKMIEKAIGKENVTAPNLKTRATVLQFALVFLITLITLVLATIACFLFTHWAVGLGVGLLTIGVGFAVLFLGTRWLATHLVKQATTIAERRADEFSPNMVVASSFGANVAFEMSGTKRPLLLFSPAQDAYCRYIRKSVFPSIQHYPFTLVVHGARDSTVPLSDSIRLVETAEMGRCRLEVIEDDHSLKSLTEGDVRGMLHEAYESGKRNLHAMSAYGNKDVDPSLYSDEESPEPVKKNDGDNSHVSTNDSGWN